ncbi:sensor domain-containing diguanylate cyclase [Idiomarina sp. HP20-50]|uniref:sensor domain-containing diguanylate cyclase n=1 Tax=Idiomarina sp. HP20-50 TaxID=3070813 RepID=UPI00294B3223|nr:sensor domain-containing diguanylate cyclase [Idiomarina sp. HP20-50]MDV6316573.1 sensor domain-containing diguanylate cyclase [Idiomarina sp. HP20-50]
MDVKAAQISFDQLISELSTRLINSEPAETYECIEEVIAAIGDYTEADRCYVFEFDDQIQNMTNTHEWVRSGYQAHIDDLQSVACTDLPWFFNEMKTHHKFIVDDVELLPPEASAEKAEFDREDIQSVICIGLVANHRLLGFVGCDMVRKKRQWDTVDIRRLGLVADMLANTLERQRTYAELIHTQRALEKANRMLQAQVAQDGLTGIANRRAFDERISNELQRASRHKTPLALLIIDIDQFKAYNDHYGHLKGDQALKSVADTMFNQLQRNTDFIARYGGEEFVAVISATDEQKTQESIRQLLESIRELGIEHKQSAVAPHLTVSIGGYIHTPTADEDTESLIARMISKADSALYRAKSDGRNRGYLDS